RREVSERQHARHLVQLRPNNEQRREPNVVARAITDGTECPVLRADGQPQPMKQRARPEMILKGVASAHFSVRSCEANVPSHTVRLNLPAPFALAVDGNDNVWVANFAAPNGQITQLCGARAENCSPGFKTGDSIAPPGGYVGGGLQMLTGIAI